MDYQDFTGPRYDQDRMGGTTNRIFYSPKRYITTMTDVLALDDVSATSLAEFVEITDPHVFAAGKGAHVLYCTLDKGSADWATQGELDGRSFKGTLKGFTPGLDPELLGFFAMAQNDQFVVWPELPDGKLLQFGSPRFSAYLIATNIGTATNSSGVKGTTWEVTYMESRPYIYSAALTLFP